MVPGRRACRVSPNGGTSVDRWSDDGAWASSRDFKVAAALIKTALALSLTQPALWYNCALRRRPVLVSGTVCCWESCLLSIAGRLSLMFIASLMAFMPVVAYADSGAPVLI